MRALPRRQPRTTQRPRSSTDRPPPTDQGPPMEPRSSTEQRSSTTPPARPRTPGRTARWSATEPVHRPALARVAARLVSGPAPEAVVVGGPGVGPPGVPRRPARAGRPQGRAVGPAARPAHSGQLPTRG
ncbi:hypothetical protein FAIPA1_20182 [Frankia sp. AiPs1]